MLPLALLMLAGAAPATAPSLDGVWLLAPGQGPGLADGAKTAAPLTAEAQATLTQRKAALAAGKDIDPTSKCLPMGFPRNMVAHFPLQIATDARKITLIHPSSIRARRIFLDRKDHDPEIDPQFNGDSIGHWEGGVLVVDTTNFKSGVWLDGRGLPSSEALHVTERIRLLPGGRTLEDRITVADPALFTRPWTVTKTYGRQSDEAVKDALCEELSVGHPRWAAR
jgi:hypothetical protein